MIYRLYADCGQLAVLKVVSKLGAVTVGDLVSRLGVERMTARTSVKRLLKKGWLCFDIEKSHRRKWVVKITSLGASRVDEYEDPRWGLS